MRHKGTLFLGTLMGVGLLILTTALLAQREPPRPPQEERRDGERRPPEGFGRPGMMFGGFAQPGRFVVARVDRSEIILLDTATGRLYAAGDRDVLPYRELPPIAGPAGGLGGFGGPGGPGGPRREGPGFSPRPGGRERREDEKRPLESRPEPKDSPREKKEGRRPSPPEVNGELEPQD
jgi:hypothetical protein